MKLVTKVILNVLTIGILIPNFVLAAPCAKHVKVTILKQGQKAPCDGFFFSDAAEYQAAEAREDVKYYKLLLPKLEDRITAGLNRETLLDERLKLYMTRSNVLATQKVRSDSRKFWERIGYFVLGIGVMYGGFKTAQTSNR